MIRILFFCLLSCFSLGSLAWSANAHAQTSDAEAQAVFQAGRIAYDDARYEDALGYFQRALELSGRVELHYNVGQTADRLRQDELTISSFEAFLAGAPADHPNRREVEARLQVLRASQSATDVVPEVTEPEVTPPDVPDVVAPEEPQVSVPTPEEAAAQTPVQVALPEEPEEDEEGGSALVPVLIIVGAVLLAGAVTGVLIATHDPGNVESSPNTDVRIGTLQFGAR